MIKYNPSIFNVNTIEEAKSVILTNEGASTDTRWQMETPVLASIVKKQWGDIQGKTIVDYGCGIGRMSKVLCEMGATVVGVDISPDMRRLAPEYVQSNNFMVLSPEEYAIIVNNGFRCDYVLAIWVLQHCPKPEIELDAIKKSMKNGLMVLNNKLRAVPVTVDDDIENKWCNDKIDLWKMLDEIFEVEQEYEIEPSLVGLQDSFYRCVFYKSK